MKETSSGASGPLTRKIPPDVRRTFLALTRFWPVVYLKPLLSMTSPETQSTWVRTVRRAREALARLFTTDGSSGRTPVPPSTPSGTGPDAATFSAVHGRWDILPGETLDAGGKRDIVTEGSMESFPASDPPSYTP